MLGQLFWATHSHLTSSCMGSFTRY